MPNRILREGILTSERVNSLSADAEVFYRRLMSVVDDFGRYYANSSLLRAALYPLKLDMVLDDDVERLLMECVRAELVRVYEVRSERQGNTKRYLELFDFKQQVRAKESRFPTPESQVRSECAADATHVPSECEASAPVFVFGDVVEVECVRARDPEIVDNSAQDPPPEVTPTATGLACRAMREAGIPDTFPGDPRLHALLEQGATLDEFTAAARKAVKATKGTFAYTLGVLAGMRKDAAEIALAKKVNGNHASGASGALPVFKPEAPMSDAERAAAEAARKRTVGSWRQRRAQA